MIEDIKEGEMYNIRVKVIGKYGKCIDAIFADADDAIVGIHIPERRVGILRPISHENGIKNTENAPKYDPCRKFRKGDKVRFRKVHNRFTHELVETLFVGTLGRVAFDERESGAVKVHCFDGVLRVVDANYLELVTPVEELEPYYTLQDCEEIDGDTVVFWAVRDEHDDTVAKFYVELYRADGAQKAAEAERDRRNAEWRKEQSNGAN